MNKSLFGSAISFFLLAVCFSTAVSTADSNQPPVKSQTAVVLMDINSASIAQLTTLGIDSASAKKIIEGRPYKMKTQIKGKAVSEADYAKIADKIIARQATLTLKNSSY